MKRRRKRVDFFKPETGKSYRMHCWHWHGWSFGFVQFHTYRCCHCGRKHVERTVPNPEVSKHGRYAPVEYVTDARPELGCTAWD